MKIADGRFERPHAAMTRSQPLRDIVIIRVCIGIMRSHRIVRNEVKNKIDLSFLFMYITCVLRAFRGVSERF